MGILWIGMVSMWKDIQGFEDKYQINENGEVKSIKRHIENGSPSGMTLPEKILKQQVNRKGYCMVSLRKDNKTYAKYVHILVAQAFLHKNHPNDIVNHKDGNKTNNHVTNLEYTTYSQNNQHAYDNGLQPRKKHRLTISQVQKIRQEATVMTRYQLAEKYHVAKTVIDAIVTRKTWKNI